MSVKIFTPDVSKLNHLITVEKLAWGTPGKNILASTEKIKNRVLSYSTGVTLAMISGKAAGSQYCFRFDWDDDLNALESWDDATCSGNTDQIHNPEGNTGLLVGVGVVPHFRGKKFNHNLTKYWSGQYKISELLIAHTLHKLFDDGVGKVIANARVPWYHKKPSLSIEDYCQLKQEDGRLFDPVLRFHLRMGAQIIKPVEFSMEDEQSLNAGCWVVYKNKFFG